MRPARRAGWQLRLRGTAAFYGIFRRRACAEVLGGTDSASLVPWENTIGEREAPRPAICQATQRMTTAVMLSGPPFSLARAIRRRTAPFKSLEERTIAR